MKLILAILFACSMPGCATEPQRVLEIGNPDGGTVRLYGDQGHNENKRHLPPAAKGYDYGF